MASNLRYTDQGTGRPLVLVHGFPLSRQMWIEDVDVFGRQHRVIAPDLAGFGESALGTPVFSMERCADDLNDLLDALRVDEKIDLLGLSMGGYVAFEFGRKYQKRLNTLVFVATHPFPDSEAARQGRFETAEFVRKQGSAALAERLIPKFLGKTSLETKPQVIERVQQLICSNAPENIAAACLGLASRKDSSPVLPQISVPVLILAGGEDALIPTEQTEQIHRGVVNSRFIRIEKCGHLINLERPQEFQNAVLRFLEGVA